MKINIKHRSGDFQIGERVKNKDPYCLSESALAMGLIDGGLYFPKTTQPMVLFRFSSLWIDPTHPLKTAGTLRHFLSTGVNVQDRLLRASRCYIPIWRRQSHATKEASSSMPLTIHP